MLHLNQLADDKRAPIEDLMEIIRTIVAEKNGLTTDKNQTSRQCLDCSDHPILDSVNELKVLSIKFTYFGGKWLIEIFMEKIKSGDVEKKKFEYQGDSKLKALFDKPYYQNSNTKTVLNITQFLSTSVVLKFPTATLQEGTKPVVAEKFVFQKRHFSSKQASHFLFGRKRLQSKTKLKLLPTESSSPVVELPTESLSKKTEEKNQFWRRLGMITEIKRLQSRTLIILGVSKIGCRG